MPFTPTLVVNNIIFLTFNLNCCAEYSYLEQLPHLIYIFILQKKVILNIIQISNLVNMKVMLYLKSLFVYLTAQSMVGYPYIPLPVFHLAFS